MSANNGKRSRPTSAHHHRRGGTIINIITGLIFFGLLAAGIMWIMKTAGEAGKEYGTAMVNTQHKSMTLACQMNLRSIYQCLQAFAVSDEEFPDSQEALRSYCGSSKVMRCPDPCGVEYVYIPGAKPDMPPDTVLVYEPKPVHDGQCNILFLSGQIEALPPEQVQQAVDATLARRRQ